MSPLQNPSSSRSRCGLFAWRVSGEDRVTVNRKYKPAIDVTLTTRFVVLTNLMPRFADTSGALVSRFIILPMRQSFFGREDPRLTAKLLEELPGILRWAIDGWRRVREQGYITQPRGGSDAVEQMIDMATPIPAFLRDRCVVRADAAVPKQW